VSLSERTSSCLVALNLPFTFLRSSSTAPATAPRAEGAKNGDRHGKKSNNPLVINKFTPKNKAGGFKDGSPGGNRKWVMPVGAAFFTGTNHAGSSSSTTAVASSAPSTSAALSGSIKGPVALGSPTARIARPNEQIPGLGQVGFLLACCGALP
jgi:hypothetical protein